MEILAVAAEIENGVDNELTGAMVSNFAASLGANEKRGCRGGLLGSGGGKRGRGEENVMERRGCA